MRDDLLQDITIYHNKTERYNVRASVRNTSILNRNRTGSSLTDNALIRVFDVDGYDTTWKCQKGDVIVFMNVSDSITNAPLTEMRNKYGKDNVIEVYSVDKFIFDAPETKELNHIKIGGR